MLEELSEAEFQEWQAYFRVDPWDEWRGDLRNGITAAIVDADRVGAKRTEAASEYMPFERARKKKRTADPALQRQQLHGFAKLWNQR